MEGSQVVESPLVHVERLALFTDQRQSIRNVHVSSKSAKWGTYVLDCARGVQTKRGCFELGMYLEKSSLFGVMTQLFVGLTSNSIINKHIFIISIFNGQY